VTAVARDLGVGWGTVMRAVWDYGAPLVDDPDRLDRVTALGVDEHVWQHAGPGRRGPSFATGIVDLSPDRSPRLLDVVSGRTGSVYRKWIEERTQEWRDQITVAALDPFRGYATALRLVLPEATRVLDAFHVVKLGNQVVDEVRRRVQQHQLGHRGYRDDPLYQVRRLLRRGIEHLTADQLARVDAALQAGDPDWEVTIAWHLAQQLRAAYRHPDPLTGKRQAERLLRSLPTCPIREVARLGHTLGSWREEYLAYFDTDGASNGPTEAMNLLIEKQRRVGHGFRNFANYRLRLLLHCGVDWQTPSTPKIRTRQPRFVAQSQHGAVQLGTRAPVGCRRPTTVAVAGRAISRRGKVLHSARPETRTGRGIPSDERALCRGGLGCWDARAGGAGLSGRVEDSPGESRAADWPHRRMRRRRGRPAVGAGRTRAKWQGSLGGR
jgi:hypothetical protein